MDQQPETLTARARHERACAVRAIVCAGIVIGAMTASAAAAADEGGRAGAPADRAALELPVKRMEEELGRAGVKDRSLGLSMDALRRLGKDEHVLREVQGMLTDAHMSVVSAGRIGDQLLAARGSLARVAEIGFNLTDVSAARTFVAPSTGWNVPWVTDEAGPVEAIEAAVGAGTMTPAQREALGAMHPRVLRLLAQVVVASVEGERWILPAPERQRLSRIAGRSMEQATLGEWSEWREVLAAPWHETAHGKLATARSESFQLLREFDRAYLAYGTAQALARIDAAMAEFRAWWDRGGRAEVMAWAVHRAALEIRTPRGLIRVGGSGDDAPTEIAWIGLDVGGNDRYTSGAGATERPGAVSVQIDLGGDDRYGSDAADQTVACGMLGVGIVIDLTGNDAYLSRVGGIGRGLYGAGLLLDVDGNDVYSGGKWVQAAAHAGVGALIDLAGDDRYECDEQGQAMGSTLGAGMLVDHAGNDSYVARDAGNISELYLGQSVAMSQGCGYGRRADTGDGHSLAGGFGVLVDGAGNDSYHAQVWAQGCGFWWGVGILEDRGGDDRYRNGKYSSGAAAHFAVGVHVDLMGNDAYNAGPVRNETAVNQYQGHARDCAMGVFVDGAGDDHYLFRNHCGGSADLASIAVFYERSGDDRYEYLPSTLGKDDGWNDTPPMGSTTRSAPTRTFRDRLLTLGVFFDGAGRDEYPGGSEESGVWMWGDGRSWRSSRYADAHGIGVDERVWPPDVQGPESQPRTASGAPERSPDDAR